MILASHNSWSYLTPVKWWMKLLRFTAQCQDNNIKEQYGWYNVRCFDLRLKFIEDRPVIVHGAIEYDYSKKDIVSDLSWLDKRKDTAIRILLDVRTEKEYTEEQRQYFRRYCSQFEILFPNIKFWCGRNLYNWEVEYTFGYNPSCEEKYASVCSPKLIDDWYPRWFAKNNNHDILEEGTDKDYLMIDFVNYR